MYLRFKTAAFNLPYALNAGTRNFRLLIWMSLTSLDILCKHTNLVSGSRNVSKTDKGELFDTKSQHIDEP